MIVDDPAAPRRARVIGSLAGNAIQVLLDAVDRGVSVLDLSEVDQADDFSVRVLAWLWSECCTVLECPRWLELWVAQVRDASGPV
jgi:hypothetical protein